MRDITPESRPPQERSRAALLAVVAAGVGLLMGASALVEHLLADVFPPGW